MVEDLNNYTKAKKGSYSKINKTSLQLVSTENWSQKKQRIKGTAKADAPDKFAELHAQIRTAPDETKPGYERNYRFIELAKAKVATSLLKGSSNFITDELNWVERGPANVGGRTRAIVVDPDDTTHSTWFAGAVGGGVWKTTDAGTSWVPLTDDLPNLAVTCIEMAESNRNVLYAGTGEGFYNVDAVEGDGIMKSTDKGDTWTQLASTAADPHFAYVNRLAIDPTDENIVVAATNSGIYKTTNGGSSWSEVYTPGRIQDMRANPENFNTIFATTSLGVIRSHDAGSTWVLPSGAQFGDGRIEIAPSRTDTNRLYASVNSDPNKIYATLDGGTNWVEVEEVDGSDKAWLGGQGWYDNTIGVNPYDENIIYMGGIDLWEAEIIIDSLGIPKRSSVAITDGYNQYPTNTYVHVDHHNITLFKTNEVDSGFIFLNGNDGGVAVSYDAGLSFEEVGNNGYNTSQFYGVDKKSGGSQYFGGMQDNGTWESAKNIDADKTTIYKHHIGGDGFEVSWHFEDPQKMIGGWQFNGLWKSVNGGGSWQPANTGFNGWGNSEVSPFVTKIAKSYSDPDLLYTITREGVYRSENFGENWSLYPIPAFTSAPYFSIAQVTISIAEPQVIWAGASVNALYISKDGGLSFSMVNNILGEKLLSGLDTHPTDEATAYLTFSFSNAPKVVRTTDYGQTWRDLSGYGSGSVSTNGFPNVATYCLSVMPYNTDIIWAGTDIGLVESTDGGASWHLADNGLPQVSIWEIRVVDDEVIVATHGRGIWSVSLPELADHKPPTVTLSPALISVNQGVSGLIVNASLRSVYDSTHVIVDNQNVLTIMASNVVDTLIIIPFSGTGNKSVYLKSFIGFREYQSSSYEVDLVEFLSSMQGYINDFTSDEDEFILNGLSIETASGFLSGSLNSPHPYVDDKTITALLRVPVVVASSDAILEYEDVAIVESGDDGTLFGDSKFWDYVIVEASNGGDWIPLEDGYDSRFYSDWETAYDGNQSGTSSMYKTHIINLLDKFSAGDTLLIRFRLFADMFTNGWGWSVDNLIIQGQFVGVEDGMILPKKFELSQNYPNPFNPSTVISYSLPSESKVKLQIFNTLSEVITTLVDKTSYAGVHKLEWDASNLASGVYFYRISVESISDSKKFNSVKKMLLIK